MGIDRVHVFSALLINRDFKSANFVGTFLSHPLTRLLQFIGTHPHLISRFAVIIQGVSQSFRDDALGPLVAVDVTKI
jgi:hypothetical protein